MKPNENTHLLTVIKILLIGVLVASLIYLFHPSVGQFSIMINGEPVASPLAQFAAIPTFFAVIFLTGILAIFAFFGVGFILFLGALFFVTFGLFIIAPYAWPLLIIIFLVILFMSFSDRKDK